MEFLANALGSAWSIFLIVLFFGGSIFVHELGHFLAARRRGVKVERSPSALARRSSHGPVATVSNTASRGSRSAATSRCRNSPT